MFVGNSSRGSLRLKPAGVPTLRQQAPRGLIRCLPFADPTYRDALAVRAPYPARTGSAVTYGVSAFGSGAVFAAASGSINSEIGYAIDSISGSSPLSFEVLLVTGSGTLTSNSIGGWNATSDGSNGTNDKNLGVNASNQFTWYVFAGAQKFAIDTTTTITHGTLYHLVGTFDGTNINLYTNGVLTAQTAAGSTFGTSFLCFGSMSAINLGASAPSNFTILLSNVAKVAWSGAEVALRYADPFGFLNYPSDNLVFSPPNGRLTSLTVAEGGAWGESPWGRRAWGLPPLVTVVPNTNITLISVSATSSKASFTPSVAAGFGVGSSSGSVVGFGSQLNFGLSAATATGTTGSTTNKIDTPFAAVSSTSGVGTLTASSGTAVNLAGVSATSSIASFIGRVDGPLVSISSNAAVGNFSVTIGASLSSIISTAAVANMIGTVAPPFAAASSSSGLGLFSASGGNVNFSLGSVSAIAVAGSFVFGNAANPWPLTRSLTRALTRALTRSLSRNL